MSVNGYPLPVGEDPGCFWHGEEPIPDGAFRVCCECGHCYVTPADLEREVRKTHQDAIDGAIHPRYRPLPLPADIDINGWPMCPLCAHDW